MKGRVMREIQVPSAVRTFRNDYDRFSPFETAFLTTQKSDVNARSVAPKRDRQSQPGLRRGLARRGSLRCVNVSRRPVVESARAMLGAMRLMGRVQLLHHVHDVARWVDASGLARSARNV
jgi:hypothetical protein